MNKIVSFELTEIQARNRTHYFLHLTVYIYIYIYIYVFVLPVIVLLITVVPVVFPTEINCLPDRNNHSNDNFIVVAAAAVTATVNDFGVVVVLSECEDYHF